MRKASFYFLFLAIVLVLWGFLISNDKVVIHILKSLSVDGNLSNENLVRLRYVGTTFIFLGASIILYMAIGLSNFLKKSLEKIVHILKNKNLFYILLIAFLATRISLILTSQSQLDEDEAIVGIMAKHVMEGKDFPLFFYGTHYNGGGAISAYVTAVLFILFGYHPIWVKITPLIFSVLFYIVSFKFIKEHFSLLKANLACLLMVFSPGFFLVWNLKNRGGYSELLLFSLLALWSYFRVISGKKKSINLIIFGLLMSFALWLSLSSIVLLAYLLLFTLLVNPKLLRPKDYAVVMVSFILGLAPLLLYNLKNCFYNFTYILKSKLIISFFNYITQIFGQHGCAYNTIDNGLASVVPLKYLFFDIIRALFGNNYLSLSAMLVFFVGSAVYLYNILAQSPKVKKKANGNLLVIAFIVVYIVFFTLFRSWQTRHLFLVYLTLFLALAILLNFLLEFRRNGIVLFGIIITLFVSIGLVDYFTEIKKPERTDFSGIIGYIKEDSDTFYSITTEKWPIVFYSKETLIGSCAGMGWCNYDYPAYEKVVSASEKFVLVLPKNTKIQKEMSKRLREYNITFEYREFDSAMERVHEETSDYNISKVVVYRFPEGIHYKPSDFDIKLFERETIRAD